MVSVNKNSFTSPYYVCLSFFNFPFIIILTRTPTKMMSKSSKKKKQTSLSFSQIWERSNQSFNISKNLHLRFFYRYMLLD